MLFLEPKGNDKSQKYMKIPKVNLNHKKDWNRTYKFKTLKKEKRDKEMWSPDIYNYYYFWSDLIIVVN